MIGKPSLSLFYDYAHDIRLCIVCISLIPYEVVINRVLPGIDVSFLKRKLGFKKNGAFPSDFASGSTLTITFLARTVIVRTGGVKIIIRKTVMNVTTLASSKWSFASGTWSS